jgi:hypothetical protein
MKPLYQFIQTPMFAARLDAVGELELLEEIECEILRNPLGGSLLKGGIRKIRVASGKRAEGKRGGYRIWYFYQEAERVYLLFLIDKRRAPDLTPGQEKVLIQELRRILNDVKRSK